MERTLYDLFMDAYWDACLVPWKIYGEKGKLLCSDYRHEKTDIFDDLTVKKYSYSKNKNFIKVFVK